MRSLLPEPSMRPSRGEAADPEANPPGMRARWLIPVLILLAGWRLLSIPVDLYWTDWLLLTLAYTLASSANATMRFHRWIERALLLLLLGIYSSGHVPRILEAWRAGP